MVITALELILKFVPIGIIVIFAIWVVRAKNAAIQAKDATIEFLEKQLREYDESRLLNRIKLNEKLMGEEIRHLEQKYSDEKQELAGNLKTANARVSQLEDKLRKKMSQYQGAFRSIIDEHNSIIAESGSATAQPIDSGWLSITSPPFLGGLLGSTEGQEFQLQKGWDLKPGDTCPKCRQGRLELGGLLKGLICSQCGARIHQ